ncbi:hypothetical protein V6N11_051412 [Hibiscus sabdariffa]|uniref:Aminotransferase-like plant mobile domain-containing protein n=1 Tax=Hibiscus sabdariffa TaxID=183260 RepID=A0ABR2U7S3_9ROSI
MEFEGVLLYRSDEHISSHIADGQPYANPTIMVCIPESVLQCRTLWGVVVPLIHFGVVEYQCGDRVLRQFNYHQPIPRPPPARQHIHSAYRGRFDENWTVKQASLISVWEERHMRWAEDLSPLQNNDFEFNTEYYLWGWPSSWDSVEEQPSFGNVWNSVEEQPPMYGGGSSSQPAYTDDRGYIPQMDYTSITGSSFHPEQMHGTPPSMQVEDQWFNDEQTPHQPRRIVRPPKRTSSKLSRGETDLGGPNEELEAPGRLGVISQSKLKNC